VSWTTSLSDLRTLLSDNATDKLRHRKPLVGKQDGTNRVFKTFEFRRITALVGAAGTPLGVFVNGALVAASAEDLVSGEVTLTAAPLNTDQLSATYYIQWFVDSELQGFLTTATKWIGNLGDDVTQVPDGLQPAVLRYAAADAYQKLALRWAERLSDVSVLENGPKDDIPKAIDSYRNMAAQYRKEAFNERDDFYKRQGRANEPAWRTNAGRVRDVTPMR
jgi:hypothetical protein